MLRRSLTALGALLGAVLVVLATALPAWAAQTITLTWVRHAQSTANAAGIIDTTVPGPGLTALGQAQAQAIAAALAPNDYDGIFVSDMVRTQLTAAPLAAELGIVPVVLPGLQEINAGIFEGGSGLLAGIGYAVPPASWVLGARFVPVLGGENGNQFEARVNGAVAEIYATGETNPIAFSHGATIMAWTLMNVDNPDLLLALTHPLGNTAVVVVAGNPEDGWTLQSWDGVAVDPDPGLLTTLFVAVRDVFVAPQTALYDWCQSLKTIVPRPDRGVVVPAPARSGVPERATPVAAVPDPVLDRTPATVAAVAESAGRASASRAAPRPAAAQQVPAVTKRPPVATDRRAGEVAGKPARSRASSRAAA